MGAAHARVQLQRRPQLGASARELAVVALGAADEDVGLRDGPRAGDLGEKRCRGLDLLQPQVPPASANAISRSSGVHGREALQDLHRLRGLAGPRVEAASDCSSSRPSVTAAR